MADRYLTWYITYDIMFSACYAAVPGVKFHRDRCTVVNNNKLFSNLVFISIYIWREHKDDLLNSNVNNLKGNIECEICDLTI